MKAINQLKTFQRILGEYPADTPLSKFLPGFYRQNKQMGSTDRRIANRLVYNYFRIGRVLPGLPADERLFIAEFLCNTQTNSFLQNFKPDWAACVGFGLDDKLALVKTAYPAFNLADVFPWSQQVSTGIDQDAFLKSFFCQPDLFIRVRNGYDHLVKAELGKAEVIFKDEGNGCRSQPNGTLTETRFPQPPWIERRDLSSPY